MKKNRRSFLAGMLTMLLICTLVMPAMAATVGKTVEVFTGVKVYVNDQLVDPRDANGNPVEPFIYNGTTYLPIRAVGNALGVPIAWDGQTFSAYLGTHSSDKPTVMLKDLAYFDALREFSTKTLKDNVGNTHMEALCGKDFHMYRAPIVTYLLNGQYTAISGTFFQEFDHRSEGGGTVLEIYGDDNLLYTATMGPGIEPIDFNVDLTGVLKLKISMSYTDFYSYAAIGECGLWT